jgi:hypothetical protein
MRSDVRDVVAGVEQGLDLAVEDAGVGGVMDDRADDDVHRGRLLARSSSGLYSG